MCILSEYINGFELDTIYPTLFLAGKTTFYRVAQY